MKIVFVQPNVGFKGHTWESLGIGYLSSYLKSNIENNLNIEFYTQFYDDDKTIINACNNADIVGFTCTSPQFKKGLELANIIKKPDNWIVFGGIHPTSLPYDILKYNNIDIVVKGEGELPMLEITNNVIKGIQKKM